MRLLFSPPEPTDRVHHGERIRLGGRDWFVVHTPGHTVDHLCLWDPESGTLLTGDHVLPSITPHVSGVRTADSLKSYLATLDLVGQLRRREARAARARSSVRRRRRPRRGDQGAPRRAHGAVARGRARARPATVVALSHEVFPKRHWGTMAESETFAHLEHCVHAGEAERWEEKRHARLPRCRSIVHRTVS